jgi:hypothetical protein
LTIVGHTAGAITLSGTLSAVNQPRVLSYYYTNAAVDLARGSDIAITNNQFVVDLPADTIFTLTNVDLTTPLPSPTPTVSQTATATAPTATVATSTPGVGTLTVSFDEPSLVGQDRVLNGQHPAGVVDWGPACGMCPLRGSNLRRRASVSTALDDIGTGCVCRACKVGSG